MWGVWGSVGECTQCDGVCGGVLGSVGSVAECGGVWGSVTQCDGV